MNSYNKISSLVRMYSVSIDWYCILQNACVLTMCLEEISIFVHSVHCCFLVQNGITSQLTPSIYYYCQLTGVLFLWTVNGFL